MIELKEDLQNLIDVKKPSKTFDKYENAFSNEIYTFDIETTTLFYINGKWSSFDYSIPQKSDIKNNVVGYDKIEKRGVCYHCQFSINNTVYSFRELATFEKVLKKISNPFLTKIIFVHNLSFETNWLLPILSKYTIVGMIARESRKPICFTIKELNIQFRCSYCLTNLSLAKASEKYTNIQKAVGDLEYNKLRSPLTKLTDKEKYYCEMDCITLYNIIIYFRNQYGSVKNIPYTQTGEMRRAYKQVVPSWHYKNVRKLVPDLREYKMLKMAFAGGITHGNALWVNQIVENVESADISSSYPYAMCSEKFPCGHFHIVNKDTINHYPLDSYCHIYNVTFENVRSKMYNHFMSYSKCKTVDEVLDNGRVVSARKISTVITDIDFELFIKCYDFDKVIFNEIWVAKKDYLPDYFINFILDNYCQKTKLKNVEGQEDFYMKSKQIINACYGACVMDIVQSSVCIDKGKWCCSVEDDDFIQLKLDEQKESYNLFVYSVGVYVTAYARRNLFERLIDNNYELDFDVVYYDTDSLKILNMDKHKHIFDDYNKNVIEKLKKMCKARNIDFNKTCPYDIKGVQHQLGVFDLDDGHYSEFITLGAKRYCYRDRKTDKLKMTVSGVSKQGVVALNNDIRNFNKNLFFDYKNAHKNIVSYIENQPPFEFVDIDGNEYKCDWSSAVCIYPTTYSMSVDPTFEDFVNFIAGLKNVEQQNDFIATYKKLKRRKI